ncbi:MAG: replication-associated recombination protein A, partial [Solirubrobacterales bacterium]
MSGESASERLFDAGDEPGRVDEPPAGAPLAARMRPRSLAEVVGQGHLLAEG